MIKRHLTEQQRNALVCLHAGSIPATLAPAHQLTQATLSYLKREKLVVISDAGSYAITEAGSAALESGMYDKQPHVLLMPASMKTADAGRAAHLTYTTGPGKSA